MSKINDLLGKFHENLNRTQCGLIVMDELVGQQFIIGLSGEEITQEEARFIVENNIGGVVLFDRNLQSLEQIYKLIKDLQNLSSKQKTKNPLPLFISVDMEGGRVHRLKAPFTIWPAVKNLGDINSSSIAFQFASQMGQELKAVGFNLNYAPCVDILTNPENKVIGDRAISSRAEVVTKLSSALVRGFVKAGILSCAKHFPGHGSTSVDSHFDLPVDQRSLRDLESQGDLLPFKKAIQSRVDMIMTAHIHFPEIDPKFPVTLSPFFIKNFLKQVLRFRGLVITDDLDMKALTKNFNEEDIPVFALKAGVHILLYCNDLPVKALESVRQAFKKGLIQPEVIHENFEKIQSVKIKKLKDQKPLGLEEVKKIVGSKEHIEFSKALANQNIEKYIP